jgi:hypothetical protein
MAGEELEGLSNDGTMSDLPHDIDGDDIEAQLNTH